MENDFTDLLLCDLNYVERKLKEKGYSLRVKETSPPGNKTGKGVMRVLLVREMGSKVAEIIWSYENYQ